MLLHLVFNEQYTSTLRKMEMAIQVTSSSAVSTTNFELSHNVCHYDVITLFSGQLSTELPQIASTTSFIDLTNRV